MRPGGFGSAAEAIRRSSHFSLILKFCLPEEGISRRRIPIDSSTYGRGFFTALSMLNLFEHPEAMGFLSDDDGVLLALFRTSKSAEAEYPAGFHIGFIQKSEDQVNQINQRLRDDGYQVPKPAYLHNSWTFYFEAPVGFTIEVLC